MPLFSSPQRRLKATSDRLQHARAELAEVDEQLVSLRDDACSAETKALVSDDGNYRREASQAARHVQRFESRRVRLLDEITRLRADQDRLLDALPSSR